MKDSAERPDAPDDINARIAGRVRTLRAERGLTLDALASACAVSRSMISLIERGESSPTAVVLEKIATGLGVPLASLFDDAAAPPRPVSRRADRSTWRDPQSGYLRRNLSPPNFPSPLQLVEVVLPAGAHVAYETGARDVSVHQQIWVLEGSVEVTLGPSGEVGGAARNDRIGPSGEAGGAARSGRIGPSGEAGGAERSGTTGSVTHRLEEDDCLAMQLDAPTAFRNRTRRPARYLVVITSERARTPRR